MSQNFILFRGNFLLRELQFGLVRILDYVMKRRALQFPEKEVIALDVGSELVGIISIYHNTSIRVIGCGIRKKGDLYEHSIDVIVLTIDG